jgi:hypothetical protein
MLPKTGNSFRTSHLNGPQSPKYAQAIADALRRELGTTHQAIKTVMRWTGASERTAKNWLAGHVGPSGAYLIILMSKSDQVFMATLELAGRKEAATAIDLNDIRCRLIEILNQLQQLPSSPKGCDTQL